VRKIAEAKTREKAGKRRLMEEKKKKRRFNTSNNFGIRY